MLIIKEQLNWLTKLATTLYDEHYLKIFIQFSVNKQSWSYYTKEKAPKCPQITSAILFWMNILQWKEAIK